MENNQYNGAAFNLNTAKRNLESEIIFAKTQLDKEDWNARDFLQRIEGLVSVLPHSTQLQSVEFSSPAMINITC